MIYLKMIQLDCFYEVSNILRIFLGKCEVKEARDEANYYVCQYHEEKGLLTAGEEGMDKISLEVRQGDKIKNIAKLAMFEYLSQKFNKVVPWGTLTGIRPIKIIHEMLDNENTEEEIIKSMREQYAVTAEKSKLALEIAKAERPFLYPIKKDVSIYVGIPFCPTRCHYCSFASNAIDKSQTLVEPYLTAMFKEMEQIAAYLKEKNICIETLYIGGGTPTSLNEDQFERMLKKSSELFAFGVKEFTCEAGRPDTITEGKLRLMKKYKVTRISINPQTMNDKTLKKVGREHSASDIKNVFNTARMLKFDNINMDLILGLEDETLNDFIYTLEQIVELSPESITLHTLALKKSAILLQREDATDLNNPAALAMMETAHKLLRKSGYGHYYLYRQKHMVDNLENVGFCKKGKECIYNIQIIEEKQTNLAFGADAVTKTVFASENRIERYGNPKDLKTYIDKIDKIVIDKLDFLHKWE